MNTGYSFGKARVVEISRFYRFVHYLLFRSLKRSFCNQNSALDKWMLECLFDVHSISLTTNRWMDKGHGCRMEHERHLEVQLSDIVESFGRIGFYVEGVPTRHHFDEHHPNHKYIHFLVPKCMFDQLFRTLVTLRPPTTYCVVPASVGLHSPKSAKTARKLESIKTLSGFKSPWRMLLLCKKWIPSIMSIVKFLENSTVNIWCSCNMFANDPFGSYFNTMKNPVLSWNEPNICEQYGRLSTFRKT